MLKDMNTYSPESGAEGNQAAGEECGDTLLCVRYRYDVNRGMRLQTVEIIVDEKPGKLVSRYKALAGDLRFDTRGCLTRAADAVAAILPPRRSPPTPLSKKEQ